MRVYKVVGKLFQTNDSIHISKLVPFRGGSLMTSEVLRRTASVIRRFWGY